jgi:hypothetical protein
MRFIATGQNLSIGFLCVAILLAPTGPLVLAAEQPEAESGWSFFRKRNKPTAEEVPERPTVAERPTVTERLTSGKPAAKNPTSPKSDTPAKVPRNKPALEPTPTEAAPKRSWFGFGKKESKETSVAASKQPTAADKKTGESLKPATGANSRTTAKRSPQSGSRKASKADQILADTDEAESSVSEETRQQQLEVAERNAQLQEMLERQAAERAVRSKEVDQALEEAKRTAVVSASSVGRKRPPADADDASGIVQTSASTQDAPSRHKQGQSNPRMRYQKPFPAADRKATIEALEFFPYPLYRESEEISKPIDWTKVLEKDLSTDEELHPFGPVSAVNTFEPGHELNQETTAKDPAAVSPFAFNPAPQEQPAEADFESFASSPPTSPSSMHSPDKEESLAAADNRSAPQEAWESELAPAAAQPVDDEPQLIASASSESPLDDWANTSNVTESAHLPASSGLFAPTPAIAQIPLIKSVMWIGMDCEESIEVSVAPTPVDFPAVAAQLGQQPVSSNILLTSFASLAKISATVPLQRSTWKADPALALAATEPAALGTSTQESEADDQASTSQLVVWSVDPRTSATTAKPIELSTAPAQEQPLQLASLGSQSDAAAVTAEWESASVIAAAVDAGTKSEPIQPVLHVGPTQPELTNPLLDSIAVAPEPPAISLPSAATDRLLASATMVPQLDDEPTLGKANEPTLAAQLRGAVARWRTRLPPVTVLIILGSVLLIASLAHAIRSAPNDQDQSDIRVG